MPSDPGPDVQTQRRAAVAAALRRTALSALPDLPPSATPEAIAWIDRFTDNKGHRRAVDRPLLSRLLRVNFLSTEPVPSRRPAAGHPVHPTLDVQLWTALHKGRHPGEPDPLASLLLGTGDLEPRPILPFEPRAIETWTEAELSALHALTWHALGSTGDSPTAADAHSTGPRGDQRAGPTRGTANPRLVRRLRAAAAWLIEHIQPDNATQHPWAVHVFLILADPRAGFGGDGRLSGAGGAGGAGGAENTAAALAADADLYFQTLLHNSLVSGSAPDRFSAVLLLDAADALDRADDLLNALDVCSP